MGLDTRGQVEEINSVSDQSGNIASPATNEAQGNWDTLSGASHSTGGTAEESLPSHDVPNGVAVLVHADPDNTSEVYVGPDGTATYPLASGGDSYAVNVSDTSEIAVQTPSAGDTVHLHWEDTA